MLCRGLSAAERDGCRTKWGGVGLDPATAGQTAKSPVAEIGKDLIDACRTHASHTASSFLFVFPVSIFDVDWCLLWWARSASIATVIVVPDWLWHRWPRKSIVGRLRVAVVDFVTR